MVLLPDGYGIGSVRNKEIHILRQGWSKPIINIFSRLFVAVQKNEELLTSGYLPIKETGINLSGDLYVFTEQVLTVRHFLITQEEYLLGFLVKPAPEYSTSVKNSLQNDPYLENRFSKRRVPSFVKPLRAHLL